jgi:hypothetical protein
MSLNTGVKCMDAIKSFNSTSITSLAYKERRKSLYRDSCLTFEFKSKEHIEN